MCMVCERIKKIREGQNQYFVRELETGYVVLGDYQRIKGYTLFLCKVHATELHFLEKEFRTKFLNEMSMVAEAAFYTFHPDKINYELLGQGDGVHMHWHLFMRYQGDTPSPGPVWQLPKEELFGEQWLPARKELAGMKQQLNAELEKLIAAA